MTPEGKQGPPRCSNCPLFEAEASGKVAGYGYCRRYPKTDVVHRADVHWCGEHPRAAEIVGAA